MPGMAADQIKDIHYVLAGDDLDAKLNAASNGDIFILMEGTHTLSAQVDLTGVTDVTIRGRGKSTVVNRTHSGASLFVLNASHRIDIGDFSITSTINNILFSVTASNGVRIHDLYLDVNQSSPTQSMISTSGVCNDFTVEGCTSDRAITTYSFIAMTTTANIYNVTIANNRLEKTVDTGNYWLSLDCSSAGFYFNNLRIFGNAFTNGQGGIYVRRATGGLIFGNALYGIGGTYGMRFDNCRCTVVSNNSVYDCGHGAYMNICDYSVVSGNAIFSSSQVGITNTGGDYVTICGNSVYDSNSINIHVTSCTQVTVCGNAAYEGLDGIYVSSASQVSVTGNVVYDPSQEGIQSSSADVNIVGNFVELANEGIEFTGARNVVVGNCVIDTIDESFVATGDSAVVTGNMSYSPGSIGIDANGAADAVICGNSVLSSQLSGIQVDNSSNVIAGNHVEGGNTMISLASGAHYCAVSGNYCGNNASAYVISVAGNSCSITGNVVDGANLDGIYSSGAGNNITGNCVYQPGSDGIFIDEGNANLVSSNAIVGATQNGIELDTVYWCVVSGNVINSPGNNGVNVDSASWNNVISANSIYNATNPGIYNQSNESIVIANYVNGSNHGIDNDSSRGIVVSNFIDDVSSIGILTSGIETLVACNNVYSSGSYGIQVNGSADRTVVSSNLVSAAGAHGIYANADNMQINGNYVYNTGGSTQHGIHISGGSNTTQINGNFIHTATGNGMELVSVDDSMISNNLVSGATTGIHLDECDTNAVNGNRVDNCTDGIIEDSDCQDNLFGVNHLMGNTTASTYNGTNGTTSGNKTS